MEEKKKNITDYLYEELENWLIENDEKSFRAQQIFEWVYDKKVTTFDKMINIPKSLLNKLKSTFSLNRIQIVQKNVATDGTIKFLQTLEDNLNIESVLMNHENYHTLCISTQVGCAMGCKFCITGTLGLKRHLTQGEIVQQVLNGFSLLQKGESIRNIVYMGMGEPFHNYENTIRSLKIFLHLKGFNFSSRRITISTSGLIPQIIKFAQEPVKANLAISLNGVTQESRKLVMPISNKYSLESLIEACRNFPKSKRDRITFEYILLKNVTDSLHCAKKLVSLLHGVKSKINLIPYNENKELDFKRPSMDQVRIFQQYLLDHGQIATVRLSKGRDIVAACGQLSNQKDSYHIKKKMG